MLLLVFLAMAVLLKVRAVDLKSYLCSLGIMFAMTSLMCYSISDNARVEYSNQQITLSATHLDDNTCYYVEKTSSGYYKFLDESEKKYQSDESNSYVQIKKDVPNPSVTYREEHYYYTNQDKLLCDFGLYFTRDYEERKYFFIVPMDTFMTSEQIASFNTNN